jgi:predicted small lipoprotein YifL
MQGRGSVKMPSWVKALGAATVLAAMLAGCGVRGNLDAPSADKAEATAEASSGQGKPEGAAPKPHKGFVLDGLLR